jgi:NADPH:quinone reductase-like Zn-dependent oxidoreductase
MTAMDTYRKVIVTKRGRPESLQVIEAELRPPAKDEVRLRVLAAPVSLPDVEARYGRSPFPPRIPFTPGYGMIGIVDALGAAIEGITPGGRFGALTAYGGYAEYIYLKPEQLIPVPMDVDPVQAAPLLLNYIVAYQCLHRAARVKAGEVILIVGASGGIGTAFLELGRLAGLAMYGLASKSKHGILDAFGASPIDYRTQDFVRVLRECEPGGLNAVFDGVGGEYIQRGFSLLMHGGVLVSYANPFSLRRTFVQLGQVLLLNLLPNGRSAAYYSTGQSRLNRKPFMEDWATLFELLQSGKIDPVIARTYPLQEAAQANEELESGGVVGNLVLYTPGVRELN